MSQIISFRLVSHLPLLGLRAIPKEDMGLSVSEAVYDLLQPYLEN